MLTYIKMLLNYTIIYHTLILYVYKRNYLLNVMLKTYKKKGKSQSHLKH